MNIKELVKQISVVDEASLNESKMRDMAAKGQYPKEDADPDVKTVEWYDKKGNKHTYKVAALDDKHITLIQYNGDKKKVKYKLV